MYPTMEDVAQRAGVSKATVSLVLNKKPGISSETQQAVLQAVEDLGYRLPERRPLRSPTSRILTILYHVESESRSEPYSIIPGFLRGARAFAREANVHLTIFAGYRKEDLEQIGAHFLDGAGFPPDGLILMGPGLCRDSESVVQALKRNIPVVVLCRSWPDMPISTVGHSHREQARIALDHLIQLGHRTIAFLAGETDEKYDWYQQRLDCYRKTMLDLNGEIDEALIVRARDGSSAVRTLMAHRPDVTAIFANHDAKAIEAMQGLHEMGLRIPEDVSVIGQDDAKQPPEGYPALTTARFSHVEVGYLAAELLSKQIENKEIVYGNIWVCSHLVERESCCSPRPV
jgi:DNA-binding LacI/PurR family transcriptional regulator